MWLNNKIPKGSQMNFPALWFSMAMSWIIQQAFCLHKAIPVTYTAFKQFKTERREIAGSFSLNNINLVIECNKLWMYVI